MTFVPEELNIEFRYMLLDVTAELTRSECRQIAFAEGLPKSLYTCDEETNEDLKLLVLHTLEAKGRFDPLNPDGLCQILKKRNRHDVTREVEKYKAGQHFKDAKKLDKEQKKLSKRQKGGPSIEEHTPIPVDMDTVEELLALARTKTIVLIDKEMKALNICARQVEEYRKGKIDYPQVKASFKKFTEVVERSGRTMQKALSASSIKSESSTEGSADSPTSCTGRELYTPVTLPTQETENPRCEYSPESRRRNKPTPLPRTKRRPSAAPRKPPQMSPQEPTISATGISQPDDNLYEAVNFTDNTGDSGVGSASSERKDWIKDSSMIDLATGGHDTGVPKLSHQLEDEVGYMHLLKKTTDQILDGYTIARSWPTADYT